MSSRTSQSRRCTKHGSEWKIQTTPDKRDFYVCEYKGERGAPCIVEASSSRSAPQPLSHHNNTTMPPVVPFRQFAAVEPHHVRSSQPAGGSASGYGGHTLAASEHGTYSQYGTVPSGSAPDSGPSYSAVPVGNQFPGGSYYMPSSGRAGGVDEPNAEYRPNAGPSSTAVPSGTFALWQTSYYMPPSSQGGERYERFDPNVRFHPEFSDTDIPYNNNHDWASLAGDPIDQPPNYEDQSKE